jgi:hypothetical protein
MPPSFCSFSLSTPLQTIPCIKSLTTEILLWFLFSWLNLDSVLTSRYGGITLYLQRSWYSLGKEMWRLGSGRQGSWGACEQVSLSGYSSPPSLIKNSVKHGEKAQSIVVNKEKSTVAANSFQLFWLDPEKPNSASKSCLARRGLLL